jgi:predicted RNA methylase
MYKMLTGIPHYLKSQVQYDAEASWSFTDLTIGREIAAKLLTLPGITPDSIITDATASIGGNVIAYAEKFKHVNAIELDNGRAAMLKHNIKVLTKYLKLGHVDIHTGYGQDIMLTLNSDIISFDPPWGVDYKKHPTGTLRLTLGANTNNNELLIPFEEIVNTTLVIAKYVVIKLPINYDFEHLESVINGKVIYKAWYSRPNTSSIQIIERS